MKITILDGNMNGGSNDYSLFMDNLIPLLRKENTVEVFPLHAMDLKYCNGCWSCWWKTPGECAQKDDAEQIFRAYMHSDFVLFASPLIAGFTSSALKKITDRLILLLHPYIQMDVGESHHHKRYDHYPDFGLLLQQEADTDEQDIAIINDIYDRLSLNFHTHRRFTRFVENTHLEELAYETCHI